MKDDRNDLSVFHDNDYGMFPRAFLSNFFNDNVWEGFGFGGFKVDVLEKKDAYVINAEMPGVDKNNIHIDIHENMLTISANLNESSEQKDDNGRYLRRERRTGSYKRSFSLDNIKADEIRAEMNNGILSIHCPKKAELPPNTRHIQIQ
jgi:HSP20 family protein